MTDYNELKKRLSDGINTGDALIDCCDYKLLCEDAAAHIAELERRVAEKETMVDGLLQHCADPECMTCGRIICPYSEPMHFHHDGCPACAENESISKSSKDQQDNGTETV